MPLITVEILECRTLDQRRETARRVTEVALETLDRKPTSARTTFRELDPTELARSGKLVIDEQGSSASA